MLWPVQMHEMRGLREDHGLHSRCMKKPMDRRAFFRVAGQSLGIGVLYTVLPVAARGEGAEMLTWLGKKNGEPLTPFSFVQLSDAHVGFNGPPDPLGTKAFERAVEMINALPKAPDLVLFTGDLVHALAERDLRRHYECQFHSLADTEGEIGEQEGSPRAEVLRKATSIVLGAGELDRNGHMKLESLAGSTLYTNWGCVHGFLTRGILVGRLLDYMNLTHIGPRWKFQN